MKHPSRNRRGRGPVVAGILSGVALVVFAAIAAAEPEKEAAVDAQCPWGRLADGHGRFVRCLTQDDAARLREGAATPPRANADPAKAAPAPAEAPRPPPASATAPADSKGGGSTAEAIANAIWPLPAPKPLPEPAPPAAPPPPEPALVAEIGPVVADSGTLSDAQKTLRKARERFAECAEKNGGLTAERGEAELRFLVQERGRAEGVSVKKRRGMAEAAAKCIADVVDRRFVGFPEEPAVGATLVVTIAKKKK